MRGGNPQIRLQLLLAWGGMGCPGERRQVFKGGVYPGILAGCLKSRPDVFQCRSSDGGGLWLRAGKRCNLVDEAFPRLRLGEDSNTFVAHICKFAVRAL